MNVCVNLQNVLIYSPFVLVAAHGEHTARAPCNFLWGCTSEQPASGSGSVPSGCEQRIRSDCCFSLHEKKSSAHHLLPVTLLTAPAPRPHCKPTRFISTANGNLKQILFFTSVQTSPFVAALGVPPRTEGAPQSGRYDGHSFMAGRQISPALKKQAEALADTCSRRLWPPRARLRSWDTVTRCLLSWGASPSDRPSEEPPRNRYLYVTYLQMISLKEWAVLCQLER